MAHSHAEPHAEPESTYFLDQLCTIAVSALLGFTAIGLYSKGWLKTKFNLIDRFHLPILIAGIALLVMVLFRAIAIWRQAGQIRNAEHAPHNHEAECSSEHVHSNSENSAHDHGHEHSHSHAHSHGASEEEHDHSWAPWQYAVLIIPAVLFFLELPLDGFNRTRLDADLQDVTLDPGTAQAQQGLASVVGAPALLAFRKDSKPIHMRFSELSVHASRGQSRDYYEGRNVILEGYFRRAAGSDREFQLFRVMVNCCGTDSITLRSRIVAPEALQGFNYMDWVQITGELSFQKIAGRNDYMPVIRIANMDKIEKMTPPADTNKDA